MNVTQMLLDTIAARLDLPSDYAVAKRALECSPSRVSNWRTGRNQMDDATAIKAAALAGKDPGEILARLAAERAKDSGTKSQWNRIADSFAKTAQKAGKAAFSAGAAVALAAVMVTGHYAGETSNGRCV